MNRDHVKLIFPPSMPEEEVDGILSLWEAAPQLLKERDALKGALEKIRDTLDTGDPRIHVNLERILMIARKALWRQDGS